MSHDISAKSLPVILQFGPERGSHGGMAAVLETYEQLVLNRYRFEFLATWRMDARLWGVSHFLWAVVALIASTRRERRPYAVHVHMADGGALLREGTIVRLAARLGLPVVLSLHAGNFAAFVRHHPHLCRRVLRRAAIIVCLGPIMAEAVRPTLGAGAKLRIIPNTIPVPDHVSPAGMQPAVVLFAGEVGRRKGVDVLLEAWAAVHKEVPGAELHIAGPSVDIAPVAADGVTWLGEVTRAEVSELMDASRVIVLPSRAEVMPVALMEAMARARPVVTTPVGEIPSLVTDGGYVVPVQDPAAVAHALVELLTHSERATALGLRGQAVINERFSLSLIGSELESVYDELAHPHAGRGVRAVVRLGAVSRWLVRVGRGGRRARPPR